MGSPSVARSSRSRGAVAAFPWNQWPPSPGMGGRLAGSRPILVTSGEAWYLLYFYTEETRTAML